MGRGFNTLPRPRFWRRLALGAALVVLGTAGATSVAAFDLLGKVGHIPGEKLPVDPAEHGKPRTILLLGSDKRPRGAKDGGAGTGARSDTVMLARLDPEGKATALLSLPRDLRVRIPGGPIGKLNEAYERGGPKLTLRTVQALLGIPIHHVVNVDFKGFEAAINAIGCIYVDVDRRYFNDSAEYAYINVPQGYQRLCGQQALEYARFRHEDTDLVRGIRQQEVIRATKQRAGVGRLLSKRGDLLDILSRYTTTDAQLNDKATLIELLKVTVHSAGQPVQQIPFEAQVGPSYVTAGRATIRRTVQRFEGEAAASGRPPRKRPAPRRGLGLVDAPGPGKDQAVQTIQQGGGGQLPVYYPTVRLSGSLFTGPPRFYGIRTPDGGREKAYRMVVKRDRLGEYYGVQGTTWKNPPLLEGDFDEVRAGRRTFEVRYDGDRVKLVAWRTRRAVYWVSNTLTLSLSKDQMLGIARGTRLP